MIWYHKNMDQAEQKPKVTPKDFFLWLGAMAALYVSATSLILLWHQYIDVLFPDISQVYYYDPYSGTIRFAIASLVVLFPLFVWLMRMVHEDIRHEPYKKELWVRRWLVFITLFVAGATIAGDLVAVVYTFLEGELTTRFILKALSILVVLGGGFWYFLHELRGTWEVKERLSQTIGGAVALVVVGSIVAGFFIIGSPTDARLYKLDEQKVSDLQNIQYQVIYYWQSKERLPESLEVLNDPLSGYIAPTDPECVGYQYRTTGAAAFELCATFNKESREYAPVPVRANDNWKHGAGEHCFARTIDTELYQPFTDSIKPVPIR